MSRLSNLLRQVETQDPQLASDLKREVEALSSRRAFGLNFERHIPETVELPNRTVRRGDKVRFLPERGQKPNSADHDVWRVDRIRRTRVARVADLVRQPDPESELQMAKVSIVDPHGHHLADALPKLRGLAEFAATHGEFFHRIESVAQMKDGTLRVLDLADPDIRSAVTDADDTEALYLSGCANDY